MTMRKSYKRWLMLPLAAIALAAAVGWFGAGQTLATVNTIEINPLTPTVVPPGTEVTVAVQAEGPIGGFGGWNVDVAYDNAVLTATACTPIGGCNAAFTSSKVRFVGFSATGLTGVQELGTITFTVIGADGTLSALDIILNEFTDPTGAPTNPTVVDGTMNIEAADFTVSKDFTNNATDAVTIALACTGGGVDLLVNTIDATASELDPANFTIEGFTGAPTCTATETVPAGYTADESACVDKPISAGANTTCTIVNANTATFDVLKDFSDDNTAQVTMALTCSSGTVVANDDTANEVVGGAGDPANFTITAFTAGATCSATETVPAGYSDDLAACTGVLITLNTLSTCTITNTAATTFTVAKDFIPNNVAAVTVGLTCSSGTVTPATALASEASSAVFAVGGFSPGATCTATETAGLLAGYSKAESACANVAVSPGVAASCTITNSLNTATVEVGTNFAHPNGNDVTIAVTCTSGGTVIEVDNTANAVTPDNADFTVSGFTWANGLIAFQTERDGNLEIYTMNPDGTNPVNLTNNGPVADQDPAWSPDGTKIAFSTNRDGNFEIYTMNADGSNLARLTNDPGIDTRPTWSPDGAQIAFDSDRLGNIDIYKMNADGSSQTALTVATSDDLSPDWSPDGAKIAFVASRDGNSEIYTMNVDGSIQTNITNDLGSDHRPDWSPDGGRIAFATTRNQQLSLFDIFTMNADGSNPTDLTQVSMPVPFAPVWSPDGAQIAFNRWQSFLELTDEIVTMDADGTNSVIITNNTVDDSLPDWAPVPVICTADQTEPTGYNVDQTACASVAITPSGTATCITTNTPFASLRWNDNDCNDAVGVRDGQWLLTSLLGTPISQTELPVVGCPDLGGSMLKLPFVDPTDLKEWADTDCNGFVGVRDGQYLVTFLLGTPLTQTEPCPDADTPDTLIPLPSSFVPPTPTPTPTPTPLF